MDNLNSLLNQRLREIHNHGQPQLPSSPQFDPTASDDDFLEQMLSSVPSSAAAASFPWADDQPPQMSGYFGEQSAALLASKTRQHQICDGASKALMLQQQLLLAAAANGLRSPTGAGNGLLTIPQGEHNDVVNGPSFKSSNPANDASIKALLDGFTYSLGQTPNQQKNYHHRQDQNFGAPAAAAASIGGGVARQSMQKVRARRGKATDPHSIAERVRRERIAERMKGLQELVPNANKTDKASMLDEIIDYVKFLELQVKVLSMSRLGGAAVTSSEERSGNGTQTAASTSNNNNNNNEGMTVAERQVAKLMEEDMGSAMQYLQGKGLCLMPISLSTAISATTSHGKAGAWGTHFSKHLGF